MRAFTIFIFLFTVVMLSTPPATDSTAGENELTPKLDNQLSQADLWVLRLASDFSIIQSKIADMIVHDNLSNRTKDHLKLIEKTLRGEVIRVVSAARRGDRDTVRALLPTVTRQVRRQILILIENDGVARQWAAARGRTYEMAGRNRLPGPEMIRLALAQIE